MSASKPFRYFFVSGCIPKKQNKIQVLGKVSSLMTSLCHFFIQNFDRWEKPNFCCYLIIEVSTIFLITQGCYGFG